MGKNKTGMMATITASKCSKEDCLYFTAAPELDTPRIEGEPEVDTPRIKGELESESQEEQQGDALIEHEDPDVYWVNSTLLAATEDSRED